MNFFLIALKLITSIVILSTFGCASWHMGSQLKKLEASGHYIVVECNIYDFNGHYKKSFPGSFCVFDNDGSFISYDPKKYELSKYDKYLKKIWTIKRHLHHDITQMSNGDLLLNSSIVKPQSGFKKVRFDEILIISKDGIVKNKIRFDLDFVKKQTRDKFPMETRWDLNLDFTHEFTHLAASYEINYDIKIGDKVIAPKGSILATMNASIVGFFLLDSKLEKILHYFHMPFPVHDAQLVSHNEVIFFKNNIVMRPIKEQEKSGLVIYDLIKKEQVKKFSEGSFGFFGGSTQKISSDLFMVCDTGSKFSTQSDKQFSFDIKDKLKEHELRKARIAFYSDKGELIKELHFDKAFSHAKVQKLDEFLQNNIGP